MSDKTKQSPQNDEVDLGQLFKMISQLFKSFIEFIKKTAKGLFRALIYGLKPLINNIKLISVVVIVAAVIGYLSEKSQDDVFVSDMIVKPYFDSKYQMVNNIDYFNSLIEENNQEMLTNIFELDSSQSKTLVGFDIEIAPETKNEILQQYDGFLKTLDSTLARTVTYEDFVESRNILSGSIFKIIAKSTTKDIFPKLEKGFTKTFQNTYSQKNKKRRDSLIAIQKRKLETDLKRVDSIQKVYIDVLKTDAEKQTAILPSGAIPLTQEKSKTREYELLQEEIEIRNTLNDLDEALIIENDFYDIVSNFKPTGVKENSISQQHKLIFPAVSLLLLIISFIVFKVFSFIKNYE